MQAQTARLIIAGYESQSLADYLGISLTAAWSRTRQVLKQVGATRVCGIPAKILGSPTLTDEVYQVRPHQPEAQKFKDRPQPRKRKPHPVVIKRPELTTRPIPDGFLTRRQRSVCRGLMLGMNTFEVAALLGRDREYIKNVVKDLLDFAGHDNTINLVTFIIKREDWLHEIYDLKTEEVLRAAV